MATHIRNTGGVGNTGGIGNTGGAAPFPAGEGAPGTALDIPFPEDADAIQYGLGKVIHGLLNGTIDRKSAGLVLYALQTASANLKNTSLLKRSQKADEEDLSNVSPLLAYYLGPSHEDYGRVLRILQEAEADLQKKTREIAELKQRLGMPCEEEEEEQKKDSDWIERMHEATATEPREERYPRKVEPASMRVDIQAVALVPTHEVEQQRYSEAKREGTEKKPFRNRESNEAHHYEADRDEYPGKFRVHLRNSEWPRMRLLLRCLHGQYSTPNRESHDDKLQAQPAVPIRELATRSSGGLSIGTPGTRLQSPTRAIGLKEDAMKRAVVMIFFVGALALSALAQDANYSDCGTPAGPIPEKKLTQKVMCSLFCSLKHSCPRQYAVPTRPGALAWNMLHICVKSCATDRFGLWTGVRAW